MTLELAIKATAFLLAICTAGLLLRRASAATRHLVRVLGLAAVLVLPALTLAVPGWELPLLASEPSAAPAPAASSDSTGAYRAPLQARREVSAPAATVESDTVPVPVMLDPRTSSGPVTSVPDGTTPSRAEPQRTIDGLVVLWATGALLILLRLGAGWWRMNRLAIEASPLEDRALWEAVEDCAQRLGLARLPRVLVSDLLSVPVLWGFFRPTLMLPSDAVRWTGSRRRVVLLHELAHLKRRDGVALLLGRLAVALWWFHPLAWWVERGARQDCERACDDIVLATGERPSSYAGQLVQIAGSLSAPVDLPALAIAGRGQLDGRVRSILAANARRGLGRKGAVVALAIVAVVLVSVSGVTLVARTADPVEPAAAIDVAANGTGQPDDGVRWAKRVNERIDDAIMLVHRGGDHEDRPGERVFEQAMKLHRSEQWSDAAEAFLEAAAAGYREDVALYNAACGYARMGRAADAVELIERSISAGFDNYELIAEDTDLDPIRREPAFQAMMQDVSRTHRVPADRYEDAVARYEDLLEEGSTDGNAWYKVGSALLYLRDFDRSVDALERAAEHRESKANAYYNIACAYSLSGDGRQALDYLERAVLEGFDNDERFANDSDLDAIRDTDRFAEIRQMHDDLSLDAFRHRGNRWGSEYSARRWEPAVEQFTAFTTENPDIGRGWFDLGWALHFSRRHDEARDAFLRQRELGYKPTQAAYNVACTYAMEGRSDEAIDWLERAMDSGEFSVGQLLHDEDLESLHNDPRFEKLLERAAENDDDLHHRWKSRRTLREWQEQSDASSRLY